MVQTGPEITLRRLQRQRNFTLDHFNPNNSQKKSLIAAVENKKNILILGGTGSGKSTFTECLLSHILPNERILLLEDSPELNLPNEYSTKLIARRNRFGLREGVSWDLKQLVFESLRMRPDRIVVGECRGPEAGALAQALQTGHSGLITTLHAGSCTEGLERFCELCSEISILTKDYLRQLWQYVVLIDQESTGKRCIKEILIYEPESHS